MISQTPIRVLCVDDIPDVAAAMRLVIDAEPDMHCVGCLETADHLAEEVRRLDAQVVVIDASMPGKDPFQAMNELRAQLPNVPAVMYSGHDNVDIVDRAAEAGAWGWVGKHDAPHELVEAVREVAAGKTHFPSAR